MEVSIYALHEDVFAWSSKYSKNIVFKYRVFLMFNIIIEHTYACMYVYIIIQNVLMIYVHQYRVHFNIKYFQFIFIAI